MSVLWTSPEAVGATGGVCRVDWIAQGVSIDTRTLAPGDLFVALTDQRDGHDFVAQALEKGAAAALVSRVPDGVSSDAPLLVVPDVLAALVDMARAARARSHAKIIAVTGSVGKTSTKDMLRSILSAQGETHAAEKSYNNHWGVPLTLARMPVDCEYAIFEIGMNHPGEIAPLAAMVRPHVALITNVSAVHLEAFDNVDAIAREKAEIFTGLEPDGQAIFNADLPQSEILAGAAQQQGAAGMRFGRSDEALMQLTDIDLTDHATVIHARFNGEPMLVKISAAGRHFAMNAIAALAGAQALGADLAIGACDLANWQPPEGRGTRETITLDVVRDDLVISLINDAFNANPMSMAAALEVLAATQPGPREGGHGHGRRIAMLGDMLELGDDEIELHRQIAADPSIGALDCVHCVGPLMQNLFEALPDQRRGIWLPSAEEMVAAASGLVRAGDVVLVKGSKGSLISRVVDAIRNLDQVPSGQQKGRT